ncbi:MAG TPA: TolC family protein [Longimicrobiales bacterium]|nr:TolC family protein [Longimicrobiales bacterium]
MMTTIRPLVLFALLGVAPAAAQQAAPEVPEELTLEEAVELARANNPTFLQARNDLDLADWNVRQAYGALLPQADASAGIQWQGAGEQRLGSLTLGDLGFTDQPSYYFSNYRIGLTYSLDWATILGPSQAKKDRQVTQAQVAAADADLVARVTDAYVEALRQQEAVRIAEAQLENSEYNLRLAQAQLEVGAVTGIDVGQAEVQVGRSRVQLLQAQNALATARMRLLQQLGLPLDQRFELTTEFPLVPPEWTEEELEALALDRNPGLTAARRSRESADLAVSASRSSYFPTVTLSTAWTGFTREASSVDFQIAQAERQVASSLSQCLATNELYSRLANPLPPLDCSRFAFTDAQRQAIIEQNDQFPFGFERSPLTLSLQVSLPLFTGLSRQRNLELARVQRDDIVEQLREQEIALRADIAIGLANVRTAYESAQLEARNRDLAEQQLRLARERYQLGEITFVDLVDAQTVLAQAEADRLTAVYAYHDLVTALETLVGTPLRN